MVFSGGAQTINLPGDAQTFAEAVTRRLGGRERLLVAPFPAIVAAQAAVRRAWPRGLPFRPTLDGRFMPMVPLFRVARGQAPRVPLLIGSNADESRLFLTETQAARPLNSQSVANETMARMAALDQAYARAFPDLSGAERHWKLLTAEEYMMPGLRLARTHAAHGNPVWRYRMDLPAPGGPNKGSTPHVLDVPLTFDHVTLPIAGQMFGFSAAQQPMADAWHGAVLAFVRAGRPDRPACRCGPGSNRATMPRWWSTGSAWSSTILTQPSACSGASPRSCPCPSRSPARAIACWGKKLFLFTAVRPGPRAGGRPAPRSVRQTGHWPKQTNCA
jgi:para-nitrobenzyl esterase